MKKKKLKTVEEESKVKAEENAEATQDETEEEKQKKFAVKPTVQLPKSDTVTLKVLVGTLMFNGESYEKGSIITVSREQAERFDPRDITVVK